MSAVPAPCLYEIEIERALVKCFSISLGRELKCLTSKYWKKIKISHKKQKPDVPHETLRCKSTCNTIVTLVKCSHRYTDNYILFIFY